VTGFFEDPAPRVQNAAVAPAASPAPPAQNPAPEKANGAVATADASAAPKADPKSKDGATAKNDSAVKTAAVQPKPTAKAAKPSGVG